MPKLSPVQENLINILSSPQDYTHLAILYNSVSTPNKKSAEQLWSTLQEITLGNPHTAHNLLQNFNLQAFNIFITNESAAAALLSKIKTAIEQGKKQSPPLVPASGNQAMAIAMLWSPEFLNISFEIINQNHTFTTPVPPALIDKYASNLQRLRTIALGTTAEQEVAFLIETHNIIVEFKQYLGRLPNIAHEFIGKDPYFKKWNNFFILLNYQFKHPSLISRLAGGFISLLIAPLLIILFLNPIKLFLLNIARKNYSFGFLALVALYPLFLVFEILFATSHGYLDGFGLTLKVLTGLIRTDFRYTLLSFLIIGLSVASALTLVFFPPALPFLLSLPYLSALSSISLPWLAIIAGATIGLLATAIIAGITALVTGKADKQTTADNLNSETQPLTVTDTEVNSSEAQAALSVRSQPVFNTLPNVIHVTNVGNVDRRYKSDQEYYKHRGERYGALPNQIPVYVTFDDHFIYINGSNSGKIMLSVFPEPIVFENGECKTALPPFIKYLPKQRLPQMTSLEIDVEGHPRIEATLHKDKPFISGPLRIFNDGNQFRVECNEAVNGRIIIGHVSFVLKNGKRDSEQKNYDEYIFIPYQSAAAETQQSTVAALKK